MPPNPPTNCVTKPLMCQAMGAPNSQLASPDILQPARHWHNGKFYMYRLSHKRVPFTSGKFVVEHIYMYSCSYTIKVCECWQWPMDFIWLLYIVHIFFMLLKIKIGVPFSETRGISINVKIP